MTVFSSSFTAVTVSDNVACELSTSFPTSSSTLEDAEDDDVEDEDHRDVTYGRVTLNLRPSVTGYTDG